METNAIEIRNLARRYGRVEAVNGLSLNVRKGSCYGFFGRNGAGKTTTIKCLLNLLRPGSGDVRVFGLDPQKKEVDEAVVTAHHLQVDRDTFLALVKERLEHFERKAAAKEGK